MKNIRNNFQKGTVRKTCTLHPTEVLLNNRIEKEVQRMFFPLHFLLVLLLSSKYSIQDDYITPNSKQRKFGSFVCACYIVVTCVHFIYFDEVTDNYSNIKKNMVISLITTFSFIYLGVGIVIFFILSIFQSQNNILLIVIIQRIDASIDISKRVKSFIIWNWFSVLSIFGFNVFINCAHMAAFHVNFMQLRMFVCNFIYAAFDLNCVYAIRVITLLTYYLEDWIKEILELYKETESDKCDRQFNIYRNILEAYKQFKNAFKVLVSLSTFIIICSA